MIKSLVDNIAQDHYCFDTNLTFGKSVGEEILSVVNNDIDQFPKRKNYEQIDQRKLTRQVGKEKARELIRRYAQRTKSFPNMSMIEFSQRHFTEHFKNKLLNEIPDWLKLSDGEPDFMLQVSKDGDYLHPHKGHNRQCSLLMLLQANNQETRWYRNTEEFEVIDVLRIPDLDKIEPVVSAIMQPGRWYLFNNREWHSVHNFSNNIRISIGIDFYSVDADHILNLIRKNIK